MEEKDYELMEKEGLGWINPFGGKFVHYTPEQIEQHKCEKILKDKLYGEIWRQIPYDFEQAWHYEDETLEQLRQAPKDITSALEYIPTYIKVLDAAYEKKTYPLVSFTEDMTIANFSPSDMEKFAESWIDAMEQCGIDEKALLDFYLLGQYQHYPEAPIVMARAKKDFARALDRLPKLLFAGVEPYDHDIDLQYLVSGMRKVGYSEDEITLFATRYITALDMGDEVWYSSMHMQLFGEHMSGAHVDFEGLGDFENAIALLPRYVDFIVHFDNVRDEYTNRFDPDSVLYCLIENMRKHKFSQEQISRFATEWMVAMEKTGNACYMRMHAYLFDEFLHATYPPESHYNLVYDITPLNGQKNFERALSYIPQWVEYMNDAVQYAFGHTPDRCVFEVLDKMREAGYEKEQIETVLSAVLEALHRISPHEIRGLVRKLPRYAEKEPWLMEYRPVFAPYIKTEEKEAEVEEAKPFNPFDDPNLPF